MIPGINLGLALLAVGLVLALLVWMALRLLQRSSRTVSGPPSSERAGLESSDEGVVVIEPGGRVDFLNARARTWFEMSPQDDPHLDRLLRRVRPSDDFLEVCAQPGQKRLNLNGQAVEATSSRVPGSHPRMLVSIRKLELEQSSADGGLEGNSSLIRILSDFGGAITAKSRSGIGRPVHPGQYPATGARGCLRTEDLESGNAQTGHLSPCGSKRQDVSCCPNGAEPVWGLE